MRACLNGKEDTALYLYRWTPAALKILNYDGESCLDLAAPHERLSSELERLEKIKKMSEEAALLRPHTAISRTRAGSEFLRPAHVRRKPSRTASLDESGMKCASPNLFASSGFRPQVKFRSISPTALVTRPLRSASPSSPMQQPLTVNVDLPCTSGQPGGILHPRGGALGGGRAKGLAKRSSFDSGINLHQHDLCKNGYEKKDSKTCPKYEELKLF